MNAVQPVAALAPADPAEQGRHAHLVRRVSNCRGQAQATFGTAVNDDTGAGGVDALPDVVGGLVSEAESAARHHAAPAGGPTRKSRAASVGRRHKDARGGRQGQVDDEEGEEDEEDEDEKPGRM